MQRYETQNWLIIKIYELEDSAAYYNIQKIYDQLLVTINIFTIKCYNTFNVITN
jgi:hypothetical protein